MRSTWRLSRTNLLAITSDHWEALGSTEGQGFGLPRRVCGYVVIDVADLQACASKVRVRAGSVRVADAAIDGSANSRRLQDELVRQWQVLIVVHTKALLHLFLACISDRAA